MEILDWKNNQLDLQNGLNSSNYKTLIVSYLGHYGFSSKEIIRFRKPNFDEASFDLKKNLTIDITL